MKTSDPLAEAFKETLLSAALTAVVDAAPKNCGGLTIATADFALFASRTLLRANTGPDVEPCPKHSAPAMIVDGLIWALSATLAEVTEKSASPAEQEAIFKKDLADRVNEGFDMALKVWRASVAEKAARKAPTHDVAGGVQ